MGLPDNGRVAVMVVVVELGMVVGVPGHVVKKRLAFMSQRRQVVRNGLSNPL